MLKIERALVVGLVTLSLSPLPALAQDWAAVELAAADLKSDDPVAGFKGAMAACLSAQGDAARMSDLFAAGGWNVSPEPEMGTIEFFAANENLYALAADDGSFCAVYSEAQGTALSARALDKLAETTGFTVEKTKGTIGCYALGLGDGLVAEVTSSGNDPVCEDQLTSSVRFEWEATE